MLVGAGISLAMVRAQADESSTVSDQIPERPAILFNRWQENWSVLADPRVPREPLDDFKYIPLLEADSNTYLSFGADARERFESNSAVNFGTGRNHSQNYLISRTEFHADFRWASQLQIFTQLQSNFAPGKTIVTPVDRNPLEVEQAFATLTEPLDDGTLKLRLGRQQFAFDLQRFVSARDGPNNRQSYDAAWADYEKGPWRFISFYSHPVQDRPFGVFNDFSSGALTYGGVRAERKLTESSNVAVYYSHFSQHNAHYLSVSGDEQRQILDIHYTATVDNFDLDLEGMGQIGHIANDHIEAWAFGSLAGYTFADVDCSPRIGIQVDAASGDTNPNDHSLGTFNPLFPNGYYVTLAGYTGYVNFIHIKPSLTLHPTKSLKLLLAAAAQWRETTADAVYTQPNIPVPNTAGQPGRYTGSYGQLRLDWAMTPSTSFAIEAVHFQIGDAIRRAGGHSSDYVGIQYAVGW